MIQIEFNQILWVWTIIGSSLAVVLTGIKIYEYISNHFRGLSVVIEDVCLNKKNKNYINYNIEAMVTNSGRPTTIKKAWIEYYTRDNNKDYISQDQEPIYKIHIDGFGRSENIAVPFKILKSSMNKVFIYDPTKKPNLAHLIIVLEYGKNRKLKHDFYIPMQEHCVAIINRNIFQRFLYYLADKLIKDEDKYY